MRASTGISGQVFRDGEPAIFHDTNTDPRCQKDPFGLFHVQNGITVPLVIERRDEENRVVERSTIGVLHAFNKRHGEDFNDEDVRLLERMARNVGSIIANLQLYREVVEEREELLQTFESLAAGLVLVSPEGRISQMNASARTIFGVEEDAVGKQYADVITGDEFRQMISSSIAGEEGPRCEMPVAVAGSERWYQMQAATVRNEEGKELGVVAIINDITDIKNIDRMKSSFVAMASHELRTPLTAIKGFVSTLLMDDGFSNDERREFYMIIDQECDRLTRLINDLLNTARIEALELDNLIEVAKATIVSANARTESRGAHVRDDAVDTPETPDGRDDKNWLKHTLWYRDGNRLEYKPVQMKPMTVDTIELKKRAY